MGDCPIYAINSVTQRARPPPWRLTVSALVRRRYSESKLTWKRLSQPYRRKGKQQNATEYRTVYRPSPRVSDTGFNTLPIQCLSVRVDDLESGRSEGKKADGLRRILC